MAKMLEVALWPRFLGCFFPAALARLWMEGGRERKGKRRERGGEGERERGRKGEEEEEGGLPQPTQIPKRIHTQGDTRGPHYVIYQQLLDY